KMSFRAPVRNLSEVQPTWLPPRRSAMNCSPGQACPVLVTGGAVAKRLRGRLVPYGDCFPVSLFILFYRVKREAENTLEIENARIHLSPRYPRPVPNGADRLVLE